MSKHLCVIDDDDIYQFTIKKLNDFSGAFDRLSIFNQGDEALEFFVRNAQNPEELPDTILLDINMPGMNGWDFMHAFEKLGDLMKKGDIYFVTSSINDSDRDKARKWTGNSNFLVKPITEKNLREIGAVASL